MSDLFSSLYSYYDNISQELVLKGEQNKVVDMSHVTSRDIPCSRDEKHLNWHILCVTTLVHIDAGTPIKETKQTIKQLC